MTSEQQQSFHACFFADYDSLKALSCHSGDTFAISIEKGYEVGEFKDHIFFTAADILKMSYEVWKDYKDRENLKGLIDVNPSSIFSRIVDCMELLGVSRGHDVDYHRYYNLEYTYSDEEEWIDSEAMEEHIKKGFRKIDLDLVNAAVKRNMPLVTALLDAGANPYIATDDGLEGSEVLYFLSGDASVGFFQYSEYWEDLYLKKDMSLYSDFYMVKSLYCTASAAELYDIVNGGRG